MTAWKDNPARAELLALYKETDALLAPFSCDASADCCHFARTGREPYPTAVELAEVEHTIKAIGGLPKPSRKLPLVGGAVDSRSAAGARASTEDERTCPLLGKDGRCRVYAGRPFGCRTFFCERMTGPKKLPRDALQALGRRIADLSHRAFPRDPGPRPLRRAILAAGRKIG